VSDLALLDDVSLGVYALWFRRCSLGCINLVGSFESGHLILAIGEAER